MVSSSSSFFISSLLVSSLVEHFSTKISFGLLKNLLKTPESPVERLVPDNNFGNYVTHVFHFFLLLGWVSQSTTLSVPELTDK